MAKHSNLKTGGRLSEESAGAGADSSPAADPAPGSHLERFDGDRPWESVRPAKIAQARKLIRDKNYPSKEVLESVADLLADHWQAGK